ncbi:hypothetical protein DHEL01_v209246 [Diaporthe helianthi]|uniref:Prostacyclin synthase n=1 Tax=Diaporthe helianthi TaxID=158607 RepID=A0A2P5HQ30_DIAHE|nr:hypothetical protein DHEL01_v209246 [Diaporthe helianthi]
MEWGLSWSASATQWPTFLLIAICALLWALKHHARKLEIAPSEPVLLPSAIPTLGHLLGILISGSGYYVSLFRKTGQQLQAATLSLFGHKVYVIFSPSLAQAALRNRDLSFEPFVVLASQALANLEGRNLKLLKDGTLSRAFFHTLPGVLSAEPLGRMAATGLLSMTGEISELCHQIDLSVNNQVEIPDLFGFVKKTMTLAITDALYGLKDNVFRDDKTLIDSLWKFDETLPYLASGILPWLFAPRGNRARIRIQTALGEYFRQHKTEQDFSPQTADVILLRHRVFRGLGFDDLEIGRMELTMVFAGTNNSVPLVFWIIANVLSRPGVLDRLRAEVQSIVDIVPAVEDQQQVRMGDIRGRPPPPRRQANVRASLLTDEALCPYLAAIQREALRLCNTTTGFRHAMRDTTLPDGTFLRAGSTVHIPTSVSHRLPEVWGPADPSEFEPARWLKTSGAPGLIKAPAAYFPFGGGKHLCPGRGFAYAENAGLLVTLALGFTISGLVPETLPPCPMANLIGEGVPKPRQKVGVRIMRREGWEDVDWNLMW